MTKYTLSQPDCYAAGRLRAPSRVRRGGFLLSELMISAGMLVLMAGISLWALSSDNRVAALNRYLVAAKSVAQEQIDEAQSVSYTTTGTVPTVLATGTSTSSVTIADGTTPLTGTLTRTVTVTDATLSLRR